jgi:uncharacterized protein YlxP (DUF503 family)
MVLAVLQFELLIPGAESLKDKRRVVQSVKDRLHREHQVSVAETGALEVMNLAVMGLACVGNDGGRLGQVLDHVTEKLRALSDAQLGDCSRQIIHSSQLAESTGEAAGPDPEALAREMLAHFDHPTQEPRP